MKTIATILLLAFLASCSNHSVTISGNKPNPGTIAHTKYNVPISGIYNLSPESALRQSITRCDSALSLAMLQFLDGEYDESKKNLEVLRKSTICDSNITDFANLLFQDIPQADMVSVVRSPRNDHDCDTLPIKMQGGLVTLAVVINGKEYCFLFDTGAQRSMIYNNVLSSFGSDVANITVSRKNVYDLHNEAKEYSIIKLPMMKIGNYEIRNIQLFGDSSRDEYKVSNLLVFNILSIDGIIGWDIIKKLHWEIDSRKKILIVRHSTAPAKEEPKQRSISWIYHPIVYLRDADGFRYSFLLDLGSSNSVFYPVFCARFGIDVKGLSRISEKTSGINSSKRTEGYRIDNILLIQDNYELLFRNTFSPESNAGGAFIYDGVLGADCYQAGKVIIDFPNGVFSILPF